MKNLFLPPVSHEPCPAATEPLVKTPLQGNVMNTSSGFVFFNYHNQQKKGDQNHRYSGNVFATRNADKLWSENIKSLIRFHNPNFSNLVIPISTAVE